MRTRAFLTTAGVVLLLAGVLREYLTKRGLTLAATMSAAAIGESVAQAALAPTFVVPSIKAAMLLAAGQPLAESVVTTHVLALTQEVIKTMFLTKLKLGTAVVLCAGLFVAMIGGSFASHGIAQDATPRLPTQKKPERSEKTESDADFIRRISKDLRGTEPTPAEIHFFVISKDASRRQKLIDLFIQERQAKAIRYRPGVEQDGTPDGKRIATASLDQTVRVWDTEKGQDTKAGGLDKLAQGKDPTTIKALLKERHAVLKNVVEVQMAFFKAGNLSFKDLALAQRAAFEAGLELCETAAERVALLRDNLKLTEELQRVEESIFKAGQGRQSDALLARAQVLETRIRLMREEAKSPVEDAPTDDDRKKDANTLQGSWSFQSLILDGNEAPAQIAEAMSPLKVKGDKMTLRQGITIAEQDNGNIRFGLGDNPIDLQITLRGSIPKQLQVDAVDPEYRGMSRTWIYKLNGDTLTICIGGTPDRKPPVEFTSKKGTKQELWVLKHVPPKEEKSKEPRQANDQERKQREEKQRGLIEKQLELEMEIDLRSLKQSPRSKSSEKQLELEMEIDKLRGLFRNADIDVFVDGDTQKPFIKEVIFRSVVEMSGRRFLQFSRRGADGKQEGLLIDPARIVGMRVSE
jgi:uncharacterized protein (TIGR03067 family)